MRLRSTMSPRLSLLLFLPWALFWVAAAAAQGTGTLPVPAIRPVSSTAVEFSWTTKPALNTQIWYGPVGGATQHDYNWLLVTTHNITVTGLTPGVTYQARTESSKYRNPDLWSPTFTFSAAATVALQLAPASASLTVGQTRQFTAAYSDGSPVGALDWSVTGGGTVSSTGLFTATDAGAFTLTATDSQNRSASAALDITTQGTGVLPVPAINRLSSTSVEFSWTTTTPLNTQIWYGPSGGTTAHAYDWTLVTDHAITLTGLAPGVTYQAQTESSYYSDPDLWSPVFTFATAAAAPATISGVVPNQGPAAGGTIVSITGEGFEPGAGVSFGGAAATAVSINALGTLMQATAPAGAAGAVTLAVTNPGGAPATAGFTYTDQTPGCGADCGNVGDPYAGQGPPPNAVPIFGCTLIQAGGTYVLDQNLSGDISAGDPNCLHVYYTASPVILDLGGHTVNGSIKVESNAPGAYELMNGTIHCNGDAGACLIWGVPSGHLHHLTIENQSPGAQANLNITAIAPATVTAPILKLDHITSTVAATAALAPRSRNIMDDGANGTNPSLESVPIEADHNLITCSDNASACQGIELYDAPYSYIHNNQINLPASCGTCSDSARGILFDEFSNHGVAAFNRVDVGANRGVRVRASQHISIHDNAFDNIHSQGRLATVHVGETNGGIDDDFVNVFNNTFQLGSEGSGVTSAAASDVYVYDNTVSCAGNDCSAAGPLAKTDIPDTVAADQTGGTINVINNDVSALDAANVAAVHICGYTGSEVYDCGGSNLPAATTTGYLCNNGAVAPTGYGVIDMTDPPCPPPPAAPEPKPFQTYP